MIFLYFLCICIIILLIIGIRCLLDGFKDLCYELAGIYNLVSDIRCLLQKNEDTERTDN